jgi:hypothetical protein
VAGLVFLGSSVALSVNTSTFQSSYNRADFRVEETQACDCFDPLTLQWVTYADTVPPTLILMSPPNNSLILVDTIIQIESKDNYPAMEGGVPFVPEYIYYHWNDAAANTTGYDAERDGAPPNDGPVALELTLPNDEANVTHKLYIYAVDYEDNWNSSVYIFFTPEAGEETSVTWTTTTTTTTTLPRRTDGFLLIPLLLTLIGSVNVIVWKRRKKE